MALNVKTECRAIKTLIDRGESAAAQCEKLYKAAGARLAILKANKPKGTTWPEIAEACGVSVRRSYQLIALAQGRITLEGSREANAEANQRLRDNRASRDAQSEEPQRIPRLHLDDDNPSTSASRHEHRMDVLRSAESMLSMFAIEDHMPKQQATELRRLPSAVCVGGRPLQWS